MSLIYKSVSGSNHSISCLDSELDQQLAGSGLLLSAVLQNIVQGSRGAEELVVTSEGPYDFYQQPNMSEARLCLPVLEQLSEAVGQRLEDWPEHPALIQVCNLRVSTEGWWCSVFESVEPNVPQMFTS